MRGAAGSIPLLGSARILPLGLVEVSGGRRGDAALSVALRLVAAAQRVGEPAAWVAVRSDLFFPPDAARAGVDLEALPVVRLCGDRSRGGERRACAAGFCAVEHLLRSGAFGLVVLDLPPRPTFSLAVQSRLVPLALRHEATLLALTEKRREAGSLGALVTLRLHASRERLGGRGGQLGGKREHRAEGLFTVEVEARKDKRARPGWRLGEVYRGPPGLR